MAVPKHSPGHEHEKQEEAVVLLPDLHAKALHRTVHHVHALESLRVERNLAGTRHGLEAPLLGGVWGERLPKVSGQSGLGRLWQPERNSAKHRVLWAARVAVELLHGWPVLLVGFWALPVEHRALAAVTLSSLVKPTTEAVSVLLLLLGEEKVDVSFAAVI